VKAARRQGTATALVLIPDAYGGYGGIAEYLRHLLRTLNQQRDINALHVIARGGHLPGSDDPGLASYRVARSKLHFAWLALLVTVRQRPQLLLAAHINFSFLARWLAAVVGARSVLLIYGAEAWRARRSGWVNRSLAGIDHVTAISRVTLDRFVAWSGVEPQKTSLLPCCVDLERFTPGERDAALRARLGLTGKRVLMTLGRLATEERAKGFDEVIEALPQLVEAVPDVVYLICGTGNDAGRLASKAAALGIGERVVFAGYVAEPEKPDYYRLADAFVLASRCEGFGIVVLEALACGVPVLASAIDGSSEAILDSNLGSCVDPTDAVALQHALRALLERPRAHEQSAAITRHSLPAFEVRAAQALQRWLGWDGPLLSR